MLPGSMMGTWSMMVDKSGNWRFWSVPAAGRDVVEAKPVRRNDRTTVNNMATKRKSENDAPLVRFRKNSARGDGFFIEIYDY